MGSAYEMIPIPAAQDFVLNNTLLLPAESVTLSAALGRILAETVSARDSLPPFPASIKDGYAVISADGVGEYEVVGESRAGARDKLPLAPGKIAYITTGAPVPDGADAVVQVEDTEKVTRWEGHEGTYLPRVRILKAAKPGQDIRAVGSDIAAGAVVLERGERVGVAEVGILATVGAVQLQVHRQPRVAVLSTGDEVVEPSTSDLGPGQIRDANRAMMLAAALKAGALVTDLGIARDAEGDLQSILDSAIAAGVDVLITSGGVSMGDRDLVKPLLERKGTVHFGRVLMKPGKPLTFATLGLADGRRMLVFGLPGNPVSSFVCFHLVVLPALRKMAGWASPLLRRVHCRITSDLKLDPERPEYHRCSVTWQRRADADGGGAASTDAGSGALGSHEFVATSTGNQISSRLLSARSANALLELPQASGVLKAGTVVSALLIDDLQQMAEPEPVPTTPGF